MRRLITTIWIFLTPSFAQVDYTLKSLDRIFVNAPHNPRLSNRVFQIRQDGFVDLPTVGHIRANGITLRAFEKTVANRSHQEISVRVMSVRSSQR
jgi:protein involved in polysaccharide export with SLBB domain